MYLFLAGRSSSDKASRDQESVGVNFLTTGAKNRGSQMGAKKVLMALQLNCFLRLLLLLLILFLCRLIPSIVHESCLVLCLFVRSRVALRAPPSYQEEWPR